MPWRPPNRCRDCRHGWKPRRRYRSRACPECNSPHVRFGIGLAEALLLLALAAAAGALVWARG